MTRRWCTTTSPGAATHRDRRSLASPRRPARGVMFFPIYWMFATAIRPRDEIFSGDVQPAAHRLGVEQLHRPRLSRMPFLYWTWNSLVIAVVAVVITVISTSCAAMPSPSSASRAATSCSWGAQRPDDPDPGHHRPAVPGRVRISGCSTATGASSSLARPRRSGSSWCASSWSASPTSCSRPRGSTAQAN